MQHYQIVMKTNNRPETLERLLRVVRHRGFRILSLQCESEEHYIQLQLKIQSERAIELLINQLIKLPDVLEITESR